MKTVFAYEHEQDPVFSMLKLNIENGNVFRMYL